MKRLCALVIITSLVFCVKGYCTEVASIKIIRETDRTLDWSHQNNLITFSLKGKDGYYDIATMNADGSNVKCLTCGKSKLPNKHIGNPAWHPSGNYIVMQVEKKKHFGAPIYSTPGIGFNSDLWAMTSDGREYFQLTNLATKQNRKDRQTTTGVLHPHFSHDGKKLFWGQLKRAFKGGMGIWELKVADFIMDKDGVHLANTKTYTPGKQKKWYESHGFSKDDSKILFSGSLEPGQDDTGMDIYTLDLETEKLERLTRTLAQWDEHAHYSPDGKKIVWISSVNDFNPANWRKTMATEYFLMNEDGTDKEQLTYFNTPDHPHYSIFKGARVICADSAWNKAGDKIMASIAADGKLFILEITLDEGVSIE